MGIGCKIFTIAGPVILYGSVYQLGTGRIVLDLGGCEMMGDERIKGKVREAVQTGAQTKVQTVSAESFVRKCAVSVLCGVCDRKEGRRRSAWPVV